ncbi:MAG: arylsulfatase [Planctomycetaceae bacterium]|nr:arylsulfatase [Planctomycetaceae bacterium]
MQSVELQSLGNTMHHDAKQTHGPDALLETVISGWKAGHPSGCRCVTPSLSHSLRRHGLQLHPFTGVRLPQLIILICAALIPWRVDAGPAKNRPNIILIMADDMGYECLGANGSTFYHTPHLDRLAAAGMRFEHCYSQPICTPSRNQIMTGRYNARNYVRFGYLHPQEITFGNVLKQVGYRTCVVGKWQLQGGVAGPGGFGFDEYCLWQLTRRPTRYPNPGLEVNGKQIDYRHGEYGPDLVSDYLVDFIRRNRSRPFFAYYPMILPHWPFQPTPDSPDWDPAETREWPRAKWNRRHFRDMVSYADKLVGKIDRTLKETGIRDDTLLLFTCDNGTYSGITSPFQGKQVRGGKGSTTNAGTHVPLLASWPNTIAPGTVSQDLIDFSDLLPTLAAAANGAVPRDRTIDGRSFLPQLKGLPGNPREWTFCWYQRNGKRDGNVKRFARNRAYKLYRDGRMFHIPGDELEKRPLTDDPMDATRTQLRNRLRRVLDTMYADEGKFPYRRNPKQRQQQTRKSP